MPALTGGDLTTWRTAPYSIQTDVFIHAPTTVFAALVNQSSFTYPLTSITFDTVTTGAYTDIQEGQLVLFGTAAGKDDLGRTRVRKTLAGTIASSTVLYLQRSSNGTRDGEVNPANNMYITVLDLRKPWSIAPYIDDDGVTYMDTDKTFDSADSFPPVPNGDPDVLIVVRDGSAAVNVSFGNVTHLVTNPEASASVTHAWVFHSSCTPATSSSATQTVSVPVNTVFYAAHTVTDDQGTAATHYSLVAVVEPDHANLIPCRITSHVARADGQQIGLEFYAALPYTTYPDGTEVLIAKTERFGGTIANLAGVTDRKQMIFSGWIDEEENEGRATEYGFLGRLSITCLDAAQWLSKLPGFPTIVERESSPTQWEHMKEANINRYVHRILHAYSNILTRTCFTWFTAGALPFPTLGSDGMSLYEQADQRTQAVAGKLTCDKHGRLTMKDDPVLTNTVTRHSTVIVSIEERDWQQYRYRFTRPPRTHWNWGEAIGSAGIDAADVGEVTTYFCVAPGEAPGQGLGNETSGQQLVINQTELNEREGHRYASRMNSQYGYVEVSLRGGDAGIDPALMEWVRFQVTSATAGPRGRTFSTSTDRFLPVEVTYEYDAEGGVRTCRVSIEKEVQGQAATTYYPPQDAYSNVPWPTNPYPDPIIQFPTDTYPEDFWLRGGANRIALITRNGLARTTNFGSGAATTWDYQAWTGFSGGVASTGWTFVPDAFTYGTAAVCGWLLTAQTPANIYYVDITNRTWTLKHTFSSNNYRIDYRTTGMQANRQGSADASFGAQNNFLAAISITGAGISGHGVRAVYTTDNSTFTESDVFVGGDTQQGQPISVPGVFLSSRTALKGRVGSETYVRGSADLASWSNGFAHGLEVRSRAASLHYPWDAARNADESISFFGGGVYADGLRRYMGGSVAVIKSGSLVTHQPRNGISTFTGNANRLLWCAVDNTPWNGGTATPYLTNDALASTPTFTALSAPANYHACAIAGDSGNTFYFWGGNYGDAAAVALSIDGGSTIISQAGDLASYTPGVVCMLVGW